MFKVTALRDGNPVELYDRGDDLIEFRPEGEGVTFDTLESAHEILRHASDSRVTKIEVVELIDFDEPMKLL